MKVIRIEEILLVKNYNNYVLVKTNKTKIQKDRKQKNLQIKTNKKKIDNLEIESKELKDQGLRYFKMQWTEWFRKIIKKIKTYKISKNKKLSEKQNNAHINQK